MQGCRLLQLMNGACSCEQLVRLPCDPHNRLGGLRQHHQPRLSKSGNLSRSPAALDPRAIRMSPDRATTLVKSSILLDKLGSLVRA
jgi:hypothetical protein